MGDATNDGGTRVLSGGRFQSRPLATGRHVAVSTPHLAASEAALWALRSGGNAVDAAVAAAAACTVVQPFSSSVGGVGWATVYDASLRATEALAFNGTVPAALDPASFRPDPAGLVDWRHLEATGAPLLGSLVPGVVAGWEALLERKGRFGLARALEPAVELAGAGFPLSSLVAQILARSEAKLARWPSSAAVFLPGGVAPGAGDLLIQLDLAATLERIGRNGAAELTSGETARAMVDFYRENGGALRGSDLEIAAPIWHEPLVGTFRGYTVRAAPGPLGDVSFLTGLGLLDSLDPFGGPDDPAYVHASVETAKLVRAERASRLGPGVGAAVVAELLSRPHLDELLGRIGPGAAAGPLTTRAAEDTITLAVVDAEGNAVNLMQTVGTFFGTGAVVPGTGVLANSSLYFAYARNDGANRIVPGAGIEQNPCLCSVFDASGALVLVLGSPGGKTRVETVRQMLANVVDFEMNLQEAVDTRRFLASPDGLSVEYEQRYGPVDLALRGELEARGHLVSLSAGEFGSGQAVAIDPLSGVKSAAADWRRESVALAF